MWEFFRSKMFLGGLIGGLLTCVAFNLHSYNQLSMDCADCFVEVGWPFTAYVEGSILHLSEVSWSRLVANVVAAWFFSVGVGVTAHLLFRGGGDRNRVSP